jgi:hypothetical protein
MNNLFINPDGANYQAQAVLAYLRRHGGLSSSWNEEQMRYIAEPEVNRWHNCREQGYVITLRSRKYSRKLHIAFYEHRNSDSIHAVKFEASLINPPTIKDIPKEHPFYESKYATDHSVNVGKADEMADWIYEELNKWWQET